MCRSKINYHEAKKKSIQDYSKISYTIANGGASHAPSPSLINYCRVNPTIHHWKKRRAFCTHTYDTTAAYTHAKQTEQYTMSKEQPFVRTKMITS